MRDANITLNKQGPTMEAFLHDHQLYIVLGVVLLVWVGIVAYLIRLDRKITKLENMLKKG